MSANPHDPLEIGMHAVESCWFDGESWRIGCECQWEAWSQPSEEHARAEHQAHLAAALNHEAVNAG